MIKFPVAKNKTKKRILFRISRSNRLSFPVLLNVWEQNDIHNEFEILICHQPLSPADIKTGDVILFSFMTYALPYVHEEIEKIKKSGKKDVLIAGGGPHITGEQELAVKIGFDTLFIGSAERSFLHFGRDLLDNRPVKKQYIYEESENAGAPPHIDSDFNNHLPISTYMDTIPPLEIMRGCWWNCRYCGTHLHDVRFRSIDSIERYLRELKKQNLLRINFVSPSSLEYGASGARKLNLEKIEELLKLTSSFGFRFIEYGIFPSEVRPDTVTGEGMALLKKYVSNKAVTIGAQSSLDERLKELRRGHSVEDIEKAVIAANANDFLANLDFIVGYPEETPEERQSNIAFIKRLHKKYRVKTHLHHFIPLSGSPYAFRFPSFLSGEEKEQLTALKAAGLASHGWLANEAQVRTYLDWLKDFSPDYYSRYR